MTAGIGWTYSHRQAEWLGISAETGLQDILEWQPTCVRLGVYWDESEPSPQHYDFSKIIELLEICEKKHQPVLLSVGMKAPRWPEFYFPQHIVPNPQNPQTQSALLEFLEKTLDTLQKYTCITHWQIENEPLDPSGPNDQVIPFAFLQTECELIRQKDSRPLVVNLWGNDVAARGHWPRAATLADIVGLDLYYKQHLTSLLGKNIYSGPRISHARLQKKIATSEKPVWITELQAEPWEKDEATYRSSAPTSMNLTLLKKNITTGLTLGAEMILLWGAEYWLWKQKNNDVKKILVGFR